MHLEHPHQVGVGHGRKRMMAHATIREQGIAQEEVPVNDRSPILRKGRRSDAETTLQLIHQGLDHRADVACRRGVEGGADFEIDLTRSLLPQPSASAQRLLNRGRGGHGARLERNHDSIRVDSITFRGDVDC